MNQQRGGEARLEVALAQVTLMNATYVVSAVTLLATLSPATHRHVVVTVLCL